MKICPSCDEKFEPKRKDQIYCMPKCRWRDSKKRMRIHRIRNKLCPQCGQALPRADATYVKRAGAKVSYCEKCKEYFAKNHQKRRNKKAPF